MPVQTQKTDETKRHNGKVDKRSPAIVGRQTLIEGLNHDLAGEYQAIVMYIQYSARLTLEQARFSAYSQSLDEKT